MKILNILLANTLLASSGSAILKSPKNPKVFALTTNNPNSQLLPFVEVGFTLADYIYFQEEGDFESIVDYIITSKKINIDKILSDPAVSEKLNEVIKQSGLTIQKAKTIMVGIIAQKIASEVHDSYKKDVEEITGGSSSSGGGSGSSSSSSSGKTFTPALTKANWLLSNLGTAAILNDLMLNMEQKDQIAKGLVEKLSEKQQLITLLKPTLMPKLMMVDYKLYLVPEKLRVVQIITLKKMPLLDPNLQMLIKK